MTGKDSAPTNLKLLRFAFVLLSYSSFFIGCSGAMVQLRNTFRSGCDLPERAYVYKDLERSFAERNSVGLDWSRGVTESPSENYLRLEKYESQLKAAKEKKCGTEQYTLKLKQDGQYVETNFQTEWEFQQKRESDRQTALAKINKINNEDDEERVKWKSKMMRSAKQFGFKRILFDGSLTNTLNDIIYGREKLQNVQGVVIELDNFNDEAYRALQVLSGGKAIYASDYSDAVIMLRNYSGTLIEGSPLTTINSSYVVIKGLTRYQTVRGTKQAFIIEVAL